MLKETVLTGMWVIGLAIGGLMGAARGAEMLESVAPADTAGAEAGGVEENGTDPRDLTAKFMPYYRFNKIDNGLKSHEATLFGMIPVPIGKLLGNEEYKWGVTFEFPTLKYVDASEPVAGALSRVPPGTEIALDNGISAPIGRDTKVWGIGDLNTRLIAPIWQGEVFGKPVGVLTGAELWWPTASDDLLGTGKWQIAPHLTAVIDLAKAKGIFLASMNFWRTSFAGDGDRDDIELYVGRHFLNIPFGQTGYYLLAELQTIADLEGNGDWEIWIGPEVGRVLAPGRILYGKPGLGIDPDADERKWSFELGYRHFFRSACGNCRWGDAGFAWERRGIAGQMARGRLG